MSTQTPSQQDLSQLPFALLALAIAILLASQVGAAKQATSTMNWQRDTLTKQITNMEALDKQAGEALKNRETLVKQSNELQNQLQSLLNDLLDLAKTDDEAKKIVDKWNVQRSQPAGGAAPAASGAATPASSAAPAADKKP